MFSWIMKHPAILPGLLIAAMLAGAAGGWTVRDRDYQAHLKADAQAAAMAQQQARTVEGKNEDTAREIGVEVEKTKVEIRTVTRTIIERVPEYVTLEADAKCVVPVGAVVLLNAAASGNPPPAGTPGEPIDAPSGVDLSEVVRVTTENYGTYHEVVAQLIGWQEWYARIEKDWPRE